MTTQPQTVTIAQARASGATGLLVLDTAANMIAALPNPALVSRVASFTVSAPAALTATQMSTLVQLGAKLHAAPNALQLVGASALSVTQLTGLEGLPGFTVGQSATINLTDTTAHIVGMLASHSAWFAQLSTITIQLDGTSIGAYPATQINGLITHGKTVVFMPSPGHTTLSIAAAAHDLATNTASLNALGSHQPLSIAVTNDGTAISALDAASLLTLQGFNPAAHTLTIADSGANLSPRLTGLLGHGYGSILVNSGTLAGTAIQLLDASLHFAAGSHAQMTASATLSTTTAAALAGLPGFSSAAGAVLTVADTANALLATSPAWLNVAGAVSLTADAMMTASSAVRLAQIASALDGGLSLNGHSVTVADTLNALTTLTGQAGNLVTNVQLTSDSTANVAQFELFRALPNASAGGHLITIIDTANNLLAMTGASGLVGATGLSADANINAAQLATLSSLPSLSAAGHAITVTDTATNLLALSPASLTQVTATALSADAMVTASQAQTLFAEPGFSSGGHQITIADTAANLLGLPHAVQVAATILSLSADQAVSASMLTQLATLGLKFSENGHTLTCQDSALALATLTPAPLALASAEILRSSATVSASTAASLSALPNFQLAQGASLTVQDTVADLIALGQGAQAVISLEDLPAGSTVTVSAAQAVALSALPHFSSANANISIADSVANLIAAGSHVLDAVGTDIEVIDTAANLATSAGSPLVHASSVVQLSGNAQVSAVSAAQLATIPHFSAGVYQLTVVDTAAHMAAQASAVRQVANQAVVTDSGPINTQAADALATLSAAGLLSFQGGDQLLVQDSYAALTDPAHASGLTLAARIGILDTATNLVSAASHNWGALNPNYALSRPDIISGATATSLAALGSHFSTAGYALTVVDTAASVVGASAALSTLAISAKVTDSVANIDAQASGLSNLGQAITSIQFTDITPVSAAAAAGLSSLVGLITGPALHIADTATHVDTVLSQLLTLQPHLTITIVDSVANIAPVAAELAQLGTAATVVLTDTNPTSAAIAAALLPVSAILAPGTALAVTDTGLGLAAHSAALAAMSSVVGAIVISDGMTQSIATAAALVPLDSHLSAAQMLSATGSVSAFAASFAALSRLYADGHLASIQISGASVADVITNTTRLNALPAHIVIADSALDVDAGLSALAHISGLDSIALTDGGTPALSMSLATLDADASVLSKIASAYTIVVSDTASQIAADLAAGSASVISAHLSQIGQIVTNDGQPVVLSQSVILDPGIDDGDGSALAKFAGPVSATGVDVAHVGQIISLAHCPSSITISDTATNIAGDLALSGGSALIAALPFLTSLTTSDSQPITLDASVAMHNHVDDNASSALALLHGTGFVITNATVADMAGISTLYVAPSAITVSDTAAAISADLALSTSALVANLPTLTQVFVSDNGPIVLTEAQLLTQFVDDGVGSVLSKVIGGTLSATGVVAGDLTAVLALPVAPTTISITDTAAHIVSNLANEVANISRLSAIDVIGGSPLTLTAAEALSAHVDDGSASLIDLVQGHAFTVSGASVAQISALANLPYSPASISVTDTSGNIVNDLMSGSSALAVLSGQLGALTVTHGALSLSTTQATTILGSPILDSVLAHLSQTMRVVVSGVPVTDVTYLASSGWSHLDLSVSDTTANIALDVSLGNSALSSNQALIASVTLTAGGNVDATELAAMAALPSFNAADFPITLEDSAAATLALSSGTRSLARFITISDTSAQITASLDALAAASLNGLTVNLTDPNPVLSISGSQYQADRAVIDAITSPGSVGVMDTASPLAGLATVLAHDQSVGSVTVYDDAANIISNLAALLAIGSKLLVSLSDTSITANLVAPLLSIPSLNLSGLSVVDTGTQIAAVVEQGNAAAINYLNTYGASLSADSPVGVADVVALESLTNFNKNGHVLVVWDTVQHLTAPAYTTALTSGLIDRICLKVPGGTAAITATSASILFSLPGFTTSTPTGDSNSLIVSDTAAHLDAQLAVLAAHRSAIDGIVVNTGGVINDQLLSDLQSITASAGAGVSLIVRDTAAVIAANAATQAQNHPISPVEWALSGNATVSEATAVILGSIPNFSADGYAITIALNTDTAISVADANTLGNLASSISLGGFHLTVTGSVAQLSSLSAGALQLITPCLTDTALNIEALSQSSPLLHGTVDVTGADSLTSANVVALLGMIHSGAQGIAPGAISFDNVHAVNDTVANVRALVGSNAWMNNVFLHASFRVAAQDSIAAFINPLNTPLLQSLSANTLSSNATVSATSATTLASLATGIHFSKGGFYITVQDSASNLLSSGNVAGLTLADVVQLSGPTHIDAADAETLLSLPHFTLVAPLTIVDSSANLLDGQLASVIQHSGLGNHIQVQLAGPETLDAETATSLVAIPGFEDNVNLSITDDSPYLLNGANLAAEQLASQVTLAGDETVSANTVLRLSQLPHFTPGGSHLVLASNDFADAATLKALAEMGAAFDHNAHSVTMTNDALDLTPAEFMTLQGDGVLQNGHQLGFVATSISSMESGGVISIAGSGLAGGTVRLYASDGHLLLSQMQGGSNFIVSATDASPGQNFSLTEASPIAATEGAPIMVLDAATLESEVSRAGVSFATNGAIEIDSGKFINLYTSGAVPNQVTPALVYDPSARTLSLDIPGQAMTTLVTLGGSCHPSSLDASEILFKTHG